MVIVGHRIDREIGWKLFRFDQLEIVLIVILHHREPLPLGQLADVVVVGGFVGNLPGGGVRRVKHADDGGRGGDGGEQDFG
jgi:hypothetical protein